MTYIQVPWYVSLTNFMGLLALGLGWYFNVSIREIVFPLIGLAFIDGWVLCELYIQKKVADCEKEET